MDKRKRMEELIKEIEIHNRNYYELDNPTISDIEYDKLYYELVDLEKELNLVLPNSPTQRVGGDVLSGFKKKVHEVRLYSLNKVRSTEELDKWIHDMKEYAPDTIFTLEYKFDGLQLVIEYEDGKYKSATTRGNGMVGEDVTAQVKTIRSLPLEIPFKGKLIVQGEGMMTQSALKKYNEKAKEPLKNARNGVAGAIRNLDPKETAKRRLDFFCYSILKCDGKEFNSQIEMHNFLKENGFNVGDYFKTFSTIEEAEKEIERIDKIKGKLDIMIDGMVLKMNNVKERATVGYTNKFPKWAMAYKFEAQELTTILNNVVWQVGRTGKITPIAEVEPIELAGAIIKRATLNNIEDIERKKVSIGSRVFIRRSNEVIPEILGLAEEGENAKPIVEPTTCPCCGSELVKKGPLTFCPNFYDCKDQVVQRLTHFASREGMNIDGLSEKTIELLYEKLGICDVSMFYKLEKDDLLKLDRFGELKAENLINAIQKSKKVEFFRFIFSLGILEVGIKTARDLSKNFENIDDLIHARYRRLNQIVDIGDVITRNILEFFANDNNIAEIQRLFDAGVEIIYPEKKPQIETIFTGKKVVITGKIEGYSREGMSDKIMELGGNVASSVSPKTDFLIVGADPGSKLAKAKSFGVRIIEEKELKEILKQY